MKNRTKIIFFLFMGLFISSLYAQAPNEVWVDDDYESSITGWGFTHFAVIQEGIDAVAQSGTVYVAEGTYYENIDIDKNVNLIGADSSSTFIDGQGLDDCIRIYQVNRGEVKNFTFSNIKESGLNGIMIREGTQITITNNKFLSAPVEMEDSHDNLIIDNYFSKGRALIIKTSWKNTIQNNEFYLEEGAGFVMFNSDYNEFISNTISDTNNNIPCRGAYFYGCDNNLFSGNTVDGFRRNIILVYCNGWIIADNEILSDLNWGDSGILLFHSKDNDILNNELSSEEDAGISLFNNASNNLIQGNSISNYQRGIELYYDSNKNEIVNNQISNHQVGIRLDKTTENVICKNNFLDNEKQAYDSGGNSWCLNGEGNYWSDYSGEDTNQDGIGDSCYFVTDSVRDDYPFMKEVVITPAEVPSLEVEVYEAPIYEQRIVEDNETWENTTVEIKGPVMVQNNCSLTLRNVTISSNGADWWLFHVGDNASLSIYESKIYGKGNSIRAVGENSKLRIEDSELYDLGPNDSEAGINSCGSEVIMKNNLIDGTYAGIRFYGSDNLDYQIENNTISNSRVGIKIETPSVNNSLIGNTFKNIIDYGLSIENTKNGTISDNTFEDIWGPFLHFAGNPEDVSDNLIYNNNFINCGLPPQGHAGELSYWSHNTQGNYWSDYLDYYPSSRENPSYPGVWNIPFTAHLDPNSSEDYKEYGDQYPSMHNIHDENVPVTPILLSPTNAAAFNAINFNVINPIFSWTSSGDSTLYRLQVSEDASFLNPLINRDNIDATSASCILRINKIYHWRVIAKNKAGYSNWSETWSFSAMTDLPRTFPISPRVSLEADNLSVTGLEKTNPIHEIKKGSHKKDQLLGTWPSQGVYCRDSNTGLWVKMTTPAVQITSGDLDGDKDSDILGIWPNQEGVWLKKSSTKDWTRLAFSAFHITSGDMNGDRKDDLLGTWKGQGVFYKDSNDDSWVKMAQTAALVEAADLDEDGSDDLIGLWPDRGGVWVKYSNQNKWEKLASTAVDIATGDMNGDGKDDLLGTWKGKGVYYLDLSNQIWVKMAIPSELVAAGDMDGDGRDDLVGLWREQGGVWVKHSSTGKWDRLSSEASDIDCGKFSKWFSSEKESELMKLNKPFGGYAEGPGFFSDYEDLSNKGPEGWNFRYQKQKNLIPPAQEEKNVIELPPGFRCIEERNLIPRKIRNKDREN